MKKAYINPETSIVLVTMQPMLAGSPDGFNNTPDDTTTITPDEMLSREKRKSVWDEEEEEELY